MTSTGASIELCMSPFRGRSTVGFSQLQFMQQALSLQAWANLSTFQELS